MENGREGCGMGLRQRVAKHLTQGMTSDVLRTPYLPWGIL